MLEKLHEHINLELRVNTRTDTIFVITAIVFNFVMMGISSMQASEAVSANSDNTTTPSIVLAITLTLTVLVTGIAIAGLLMGRATRRKLTQGLLKMYADAEVDQYYDPALLVNYMRRYVIFVTIIGLLGLTALAIPLVVLLTG
jgi:hypothetical protein